MTHEQAFELVKRGLMDECFIPESRITLDARVLFDLDMDRDDLGNLFGWLDREYNIPYPEVVSTVIDFFPTVRYIVEHVVTCKEVRP